jgi:hypothetical protein
MSNIIINIFTPQELNHSSYIQTGLFELEGQGFLKTRVITSVAKRLGTIKINGITLEETNQPHPKTSFYQLTDTKSGKKIHFATDLYDASHSFSKYALEHCDYVFKRNFETGQVSRLPLAYQQKIVPLGLTFGTHSKHKKGSWKFFAALLITNLRIDAKPDRLVISRILNSLKKQLQHWRFVKTTRCIEDFEKYEAFEKNDILFQTRCFLSEEQEDVRLIHQQRFRIIQLLRNNFKANFKGGIIPSEMANKKYKEALTDLPADPVSYLNFVKKAKIAIYTRGLLHSPAWKMAEYLSQGKVIVAEKLTAELPVPLLNGNEVLFFDTEGEMVNLIQKVLSDDNLASNLSHNARLYFEKQVHPKENVKRILTFMLNQK